jgi:hypothetical protein
MGQILVGGLLMFIGVVLGAAITMSKNKED